MSQYYEIKYFFNRFHWIKNRFFKPLELHNLNKP